MNTILKSVVVSLLTTLPILLSAQCTELFFSEYVEGSSNNKCLEIFNPTGAMVDLSDYTIEIYSAGSTTSGNTIALSGMLADGAVFVVCDDATTIYTPDLAAIGSFFNGNDAIALNNSGTIVDVIGTIGFDPGSQWDCSGDPSTQNNTLVRIPEVICGLPGGFGGGVSPDGLCDQWIQYDQDDVSNLGMHTYNGAQANSCTTISPPAGATIDGCEGNTIIDLTSEQTQSWYSFNFYLDQGATIQVAQNVLVYDPMITMDASPLSIWVSMTNDTCETSTSEYILNILPGPSVLAEAADSVVCEGDDIVLMETGGEVTSWEWTGPDGFTYNTDANPVITGAVVSNSGTYTVVGMDNGGCVGQSSVEISVIAPIVAPVVPTVAVCDAADAIITPPVQFIDVLGEACDLFFSQYIEGNSDNKCLEIYNGTSQNIDLSDYEIYRYSNGATSPSSTTQLSSFILIPGETYVICNASAESRFLNLADQTIFNPTNFNGNDVIALIKNGIHIDVIGQIGDDSNFAQNVTLIRNPSISCGDSNGDDLFDPAAEWTDLGNDVETDLGTHNYAGLSPTPIQFNFYDDAGLLTLLDGPADSYTVGGPDTLYVTAVHDDCESPATEVAVRVSDGIPEGLACNSTIRISLGEECNIPTDPRIFLQGDADFDFYQVSYEDAFGNTLSIDRLNSQFIGKTINYNVENPCTGSSCWGKVTIEDKYAPIITVNDTTLFCGQELNSHNVPQPVVEDCTLKSVTFEDRKIGELCDMDYTIIRKYTAMDEFGNVSTAEQNIFFQKLNPDMILEPTEFVITDCGIVNPDDIYNFTGNIEDAYPTIDGLPLTEGEYCNFSVWKDDKIVYACGEACPDSKKVVRTWNIIDWCAEGFALITYKQTISAKDTTPPTLPPVGLVRANVNPWSCAADVILPTDIGSDNCSGELSYHYSGPIGIEIENGIAYNVPYGVHTFKMYAEDCCGNQSDIRDFTVEVYDGVAPTAIAKEEVVVTLTQYYDDEDLEGIAKIFPESIDNESFDMCGPVTFRVRRENDPCREDSDEWGEYVTFCCRDAGKEIEVWLEVTDEAGNTSVTWANVKVEDKEAYFECKDLNLFCHDDIEDAITDRDNRPRAYSICGNLRIEEVERDYTDYNSTCDYGVIYVTYQVEGRPDVKCTQTVNVHYKGGFTCENVNWPDETTIVGCMDLPEPNLTWEAGPCELIGWNVDSDTFSFNTAEACLKIINEYTVIDWCIYDYGQSYGQFPDYKDGGYNCNNTSGIVQNKVPGVYHYVEVIKVVDTISPILANTDDWIFPVESNDCSIQLKIDNSAYEPNECHNQHFNWQLDLDYDHDGTFDETLNEYGVTDTWLMLPELQYGPMDSISARWKVWDGCGNATLQPFKIFIIDAKAPIPYCIDVASALMTDGSVEIWANDFDRGSRDNCYNQDELLFTFDEIHPDLDYLGEEHYFDENGRIANHDDALAAYRNGDAQRWIPDDRTSGMIFTCDDAPVVTVKMTVWDQKLNYDFCTVELSLTEQDGDCLPTPFIAGFIHLEDLRAVEDVDVTLESLDGGQSQNTVTDNEGVYTFKNLTMNGNYSIQPSKKGDTKNGVTTEDMLLIQKHIMEDEEFTSPYKVIAADVNDDQKLSAMDLILIQRLSIGLLDNFKAGAWKFINSDQNLNIENALTSATNITMIEDIVQPMMDRDFVAVKVGDVNNDVVLNAREGLTTRSRNAISFGMQDMEISAGQEITVPVSIIEKEMAGYQMAIHVSDAEIVHIENSLPEISPLVTRKAGSKAFFSFGNGQIFTPSGEIMQLTLKALKDGKLSDMIAIDEDNFRTEAYVGSHLHHRNIALVFTSPEEAFDMVSLQQNVPNPYKGETSINFSLPQDGQATISIMAVDGKTIYNKTANYNRGQHQLLIRESDLEYKSGVFYYTLTYKGSILTRKMIVLE